MKQECCWGSGDAGPQVTLFRRLKPQFLAAVGYGALGGKSTICFPPKTLQDLRFPPASGCGAGQAAGSCRGGGCYSGAAEGVWSAWGTLCSRWASWLRASHLAKSQTSSPVGGRHESDQEEKYPMCQAPLHFLVSKENYRLRNKCIKLHPKFPEDKLLFSLSKTSQDRGLPKIQGSA